MPKPNSDCRATERKHPWPMVRLGDVCEILDSKRVPITKKDRVCGDIPYYGATGVVDYVSDFIFDERLVLLGEDGAKWGAGDNSAFIIEGKSWVNNHAHVLRPMSLLDDSFLVWYLNYADLGEYITGVTVPKLNQQRMGQIEIPLPPLSVQREIVARLERELAAVEKMKNGFETLAETAKAEFKAELKEVFEEISRGGAEMRRLGEVCEFMTSGSRGWAKYYSDSGELFITIKNVKDCAIDVRNVQHVKPPKGAEAERTRVKEGDLLISITADLGRTGIVTKAIETTGAYINQHLICIRLKKEVMLPIFAAYYIESEGGKKQILHRNKEAVKAGLNFASVSSILLPFSSLPAQREVVARLDGARAKAEKLEAKAREGVAVCETMRKAILKEAFSPYGAGEVAL